MVFNNFQKILLSGLVSMMFLQCEDSEREHGKVIRDLYVTPYSTWGADCILSVYDIDETGPGKKYTVISRDGKSYLGFDVSITRQPAPNDTAGSMVFATLGDTSNAFLKKLASIFEMPDSVQYTFAPSVTVPFIDMNRSAYGRGNKQKRDVSYYQCYFGDSLTGHYAELLISINDDRRFLEMEEKNIQYREDLMYFFTGGK